MQHLQTLMCLPTDSCRQLNPFFPFQVCFKIIVFLSCRLKMKDNRCEVFFFCSFKAEFFNIWFFLEETVVKGFIDVCVCDTYDSYGGVRKNLLNISNFQLFVFFHCRHKMKYYQDSSVIRSWFVQLVLGLKKALPRNSTKVKVEPAGFSQQITRKVSYLTYSLSGAASGVSPYSFCLLLFRDGGGGGQYQRCRRTITVFVTVFDET